LGDLGATVFFTNAKLSVLLSAKAIGKKILVSFPDGVDCKTYNPSIAASAVRIADRESN